MNFQEIKPTSGNANSLMVMLHGVGSDSSDLIGLAPFFQKSLPDCHFFSPDAVEPYDMAPYGRQWFSLQDRSAKTIIKLVRKNAPELAKIIQEKQKSLGLTNKETIILGFSQGTMIASYLTLIQDVPFAGMIGFSGRLVPPMDIENTDTDFCLIHGEEDDIVDVQESVNMSTYCDRNNIRNELLIVPNLTHSIDSSGIEFATNFARRMVAQTASSK